MRTDLPQHEAPELATISESHALTDEGRAEYQALRAEIVERLRAQQQVSNYALALFTATVAGSLALAGRVDMPTVREFFNTTAALPLTVLALLFAALAAVYAEHEVMIAHTGRYIATTLLMPWEHAFHGRPVDRPAAAAKLLLSTLFAGKYILAFLPAIAMLSFSTVGIAGSSGIWALEAQPLLVWFSRGLWGATGVILACSAAGIALTVRKYWTLGKQEIDSRHVAAHDTSLVAVRRRSVLSESTTAGPLRRNDRRVRLRHAGVHGMRAPMTTPVIARIA